MRFYSHSHMDVPAVAPLRAHEAEPRPVSWPLAAAVIGGLSLGLWALIYRLLAALFGF